MLDIEIRTDSVHIEGYVNAVERKSRKIKTKDGICYEVIKAGAFADSLGRNAKVKLLHNHDLSKEIGVVTLNEDSIGLRAIADITDAETIQLAKDNRLNGWSFGFFANDRDIKKEGADAPTRYIKSLDLYEVSLIDDTQIPCYEGTSIEYRSENENGEVVTATLECRSEKDYSTNKEIALARLKCIEIRYNQYHDPEDGKFCSANGTGKGSMIVVPKGEKAYRKELNRGFSDEEIDDLYELHLKRKNQPNKYAPSLEQIANASLYGLGRVGGAGENEFFRYGNKAQEKVLAHLEPNKGGYISLPVKGGVSGEYWDIGHTQGKYGDFAIMYGYKFPVNKNGELYAKDGTSNATALKFCIKEFAKEMKETAEPKDLYSSRESEHAPGYEQIHQYTQKMKKAMANAEKIAEVYGRTAGKGEK